LGERSRSSLGERSTSTLGERCGSSLGERLMSTLGERCESSLGERFTSRPDEESFIEEQLLSGDLDTAADISLAEVSVTASNTSRSQQAPKRRRLSTMASASIEPIQSNFSEISAAIVQMSKEPIVIENQAQQQFPPMDIHSTFSRYIEAEMRNCPDDDALLAFKHEVLTSLMRINEACRQSRDTSGMTRGESGEHRTGEPIFLDQCIVILKNLIVTWGSNTVNTATAVAKMHAFATAA